MTEYSPEGSRAKLNLETGVSSLSDYADPDANEIFSSSAVNIEDEPFAADVNAITEEDDAQIERKKSKPKKGDWIRGERFTFEYVGYPFDDGWRVRAARKGPEEMQSDS